MRRGKTLDTCRLALAIMLAGCGGSAAMGDKSSPSQPTSAGPDGSGPLAAAAGSGGSAVGPAAPGAGTKPGSTTTPASAVPVTGTSEFVSADTQSVQRGASIPQGAADSAAAGAAATPTSAATGTAAMSSRAVERGDIYQVLPDQRILNLNSYRGVQILDVSDLSHPHIEGRLAVAGDPVELYVVGDRAIVLLNNWQGYYGARDDVKVESVRGGLVMSVDIHDRAHPTLITSATVPGSISTSRLTQGGGQAALYVAASNYDAQASTVVKSFDVSDGMLTAKTELNLGGYVQDIQATTDLLMVASNDYNQNQGRSEVALIDISSPDGTMVQGATVLAQGLVQNKFNMDAYNGVLRIVSGAKWNGSLQNHLETFDLKNLQKLTKLDDCTLGSRDPQNGQGENLYATLFVGERAFFVTYYRRDPFHAFSIDAQGHCAEHAEFVVSGWNDFLKATLNDTRLIGVGRNDQNSTLKLSVSLYDASNLTNPNPLKARADIDLSYGYSEANWDDRGFSVLDDAVSIAAKDGTTETGLVLLPFEGYDQNSQQYLAQVQIFTFSDHTLTLRGKMDHGSSVRRSFEVADATTANLSEEQLSLFETSNPDAPKELGRTDVAPNYSQLLVYGDYVARVRDRSSDYPQSSNTQSHEPAKSTVQILARSADLDGGEVMAAFDVAAGSSLYQVGKLLVAVHTDTTYDNTGNNPPQYHSKVQVTDLSDPAQPKARGTLETDRIEPNYGGGVYPVAGPGVAIADCFDCGDYATYRLSPQAFVVGDALAFVHTTQKQKSLGIVHQCSSYAPGQSCASDAAGGVTCSQLYYTGGTTCTTPKGGTQSCSGEFYLCDPSGCKPSAPPPNLIPSCSDFEQFRYWTVYGFDGLDLRNPDAPALTDRVDLPDDEEGASVIADRATLYFNYQQPYMLSGDPHSYVKRYVRLLDFTDPTAVVTHDPVNIPGQVITVDGETLYTRDEVWDSDDVRTMVARLILSGDLAHLQASKLFVDRTVEAVAVDGAGHVLVSNDPVYTFNDPAAATQHTLSILDTQMLQVVGEAAVDDWATFKAAKGGRALFQVSGGLLVFDVEDAAHPKAQAYFATSGWPNDIYFDGNDILFAAGAYGVYRFDASTFNLLMK